MLYSGLCWLQTVMATVEPGRARSARGKPVGDTFLPQIPFVFILTYPTHPAPVLPKGLHPLFLGQNWSVPVCPEGCHQRELSHSDLFRCVLPIFRLGHKLSWFFRVLQSLYDLWLGMIIFALLLFPCNSAKHRHYQVFQFLPYDMLSWGIFGVEGKWDVFHK